MNLLIIKVLLLTLITSFVTCNREEASNQINTVSGQIISSELGLTLTHEHIFSNFGKEINETSKYDTVQLFNQVIPYLKKLKASGVHSIFDCTTAHFGRRVDLLKTISDATRIQIITNTGFYGAARDRYIPNFAFTSTAEAISEVWVEEFENGINDTGIKPGFIKLAFESDELSSIDKKLFEAGILTHLKTGLTMAVHTRDNVEAAKFQADLLNKYNVDLSAWIWTHANAVKDDDLLIEFASKGAWISLDGVKESNTTEYIKRIELFKRNNLLGKLLLSHDGNGFPQGGEIRQFEDLIIYLIPRMLKAGFTQEEIDHITIKNPSKAFIAKIRTQKPKSMKD